MDRLRLRSRWRKVLAVGGILTALTYLGTMTNRARLSWAAYRTEAELEDGWAGAEAMNAEYAGRQAEQLGREGRVAEADLWAKETEGHRKRESLHRRKSQALLRRWW
jgi:hypothetical protein